MMHLLFEEFFPKPGDAGKSVLHIAPEEFMRPFFKKRFEHLSHGGPVHVGR